MMAAALVANYGSSSESESEEETQGTEAKSTTVKSTGVNLLTSCADTESGDEDSETETDKLKLTTQKPVNTQAKSSSKETSSKLPLPSFLAEDIKAKTTKKNNSLQSSSVFSNPFEKARQQKLSILEQHVKLSSAEKTEAEMGKKICWMYRKGRCRFGHKCKFAHDNDIGVKQTSQGSEEGGNCQTPVAQAEQYFQQGQGQFGQNSQYDIGHNFGLQENDEEIQQQRKRKKPGLAQGMVPPKKSMSAYQRQAAQERPWTAHNHKH